MEFLRADPAPCSRSGRRGPRPRRRPAGCRGAPRRRAAGARRARHRQVHDRRRGRGRPGRPGRCLARPSAWLLAASRAGRRRPARAGHGPAGRHLHRAAGAHPPVARLRHPAPGGGPARATRPRACSAAPSRTSSCASCSPGHAARRQPGAAVARAGARWRCRTRGFRGELRDLLMRAVELGLEPEDLAAPRPDARPPRVGRGRAGAGRVRRGDRAVGARAPTTPPGSSARRPTCSRTTPRRSTGLRDSLRLVVVDDAQEMTAAAARLLQVVVAGRGTDVVLLGDPDTAVQTFRGADPRYSPAAWTALGDGPTRACCRTAHRLPQRVPARRRRGRATIGALGGGVAPRGGPRLARRPRRGPPAARRRPRRPAIVAAGCARRTCSTGCRGRDMAVVVRGQGRTATLRRVLHGVRGAGRRPGDRPPGARRGGRAARCSRCCASSLDLRSRRGRHGRPGDGRRRRPRRRRSAVPTPWRCAGCAGRCAARSSPPAAAAPATSCSPRPWCTPTASRPSAARGRAGAPRGAAPSPPASRRRASAARTARPLGAGRQRRGGALGDVEATGLAEPPGRRPRSAGGPGGRARRPRPRRRAWPVRRRRPLRRPAAQAGPRGVPRPHPRPGRPGDTLVARAPAGETVALRDARRRPPGREWRFVVVAGVQEGVWPDLRLRGSLLGSERPRRRRDRPRPVPSAAAQAAVRYDETRLFHVAVTRARERLLVTAVRSDDEQPSPSPRHRRPAARRARRPAPVHRRRRADDPAGAGRRAAPRAGRPTRPAGARRRPSRPWPRLAARGRAGRRPGAAGGRCATLSDDRPLRGPERRRCRVSPSTVDALRPVRAALAAQRRRWRRPVDGRGQTSAPSSTTSPPSSATPTQATLRAEVDARWGRLGLPAGLALRPQAARGPGHGRPAGALLRARPTRAGLGARRRRARHAGRRSAAPCVSGRVDRLERDARRPAAGRRPQDRASKPREDDVPRHGQLGAYQVAVERRRLRRARRRSGGAALLQLGKARQQAGRTLQVQRPLRARRRPAAGRARSSPRRPRAWPAATFTATRGAAVRTCPVKAQLPGPARGAGTVTHHGRVALRRYTRPHDIAHGARHAARADRRAGARSSRRRCARCSSSPAPARARPRRWPRGWSGSSPTASSSPTRCSGLTFTRKAASELAERIAQRLRRAAARRAVDARRRGRRRRRGARRHADRLHLPLVRRAARPRARRCGSASSPSRGCSPRPPPGSSPHEVVARYDGPMDDVEQGRVHRHGRGGRPRRRDGRAPADGPDDVGRLPRRGRSRRSRRCPRAPAGPRTSRRGRKDALTALRERAGRCCRSSSATSRSSASRDAMDFADQMALAARLATLVPRHRRGRARRASGRCCSTSSRTPPRPSSSCCARCSSRRASRCR